MRHAKQTSLSLFKTLLCAAITIGIAATAHAQGAKVDPTGTWYWTTAGRNGGPDRTNTLVLKSTGTTLTGTLKLPPRGEADPISVQISDGTLTADKISFKVSREVGTNTVTVGYEGVVTADAITGTTSSTSRTGEKRSRKWQAKRQAAAAQ